MLMAIIVQPYLEVIALATHDMNKYLYAWYNSLLWSALVHVPVHSHNDFQVWQPLTDPDMSKNASQSSSTELGRTDIDRLAYLLHVETVLVACHHSQADKEVLGIGQANFFTAVKAYMS